MDDLVFFNSAMISGADYGIAHITDTDFACKACGRHYMHLSTARRHFKESHKEVKAGFNCELCGKTYMRARSLKVHIQLHHVHGTHLQ